MDEVLLEPRISALLVTRMENLRNKSQGGDMLEDEEDVQEGLKALAKEEGTITWEQYQRQRVEREARGELSG